VESGRLQIRDEIITQVPKIDKYLEWLNGSQIVFILVTSDARIEKTNDSDKNGYVTKDDHCRNDS